MIAVLLDTSAYSRCNESSRDPVGGAGTPVAETAGRYALILNHLRSEGSPIPTNTNIISIAAPAMEYGLRPPDRRHVLGPCVGAAGAARSAATCRQMSPAARSRRFWSTPQARYCTPSRSQISACSTVLA